MARFRDDECDGAAMMCVLCQVYVVVESDAAATVVVQAKA